MGGKRVNVERGKVRVGYSTVQRSTALVHDTTVVGGAGSGGSSG